MIACDLGRHVVLLTVEDFARLSSRLNEALEPIDVLAFKAAVGYNLAVGRPARAKLRRWEQAFSALLADEIDAGRYSLTYNFGTDEAARHLEDFLEVYRHNSRRITYAVHRLYNGSDRLINIRFREKQSILHRLLQLYGVSREEVNFLVSQVRGLSGSALDFSVKLPDQAFRFASNGVHRENVS